MLVGLPIHQDNNSTHKSIYLVFFFHKCLRILAVSQIYKSVFIQNIHFKVQQKN